jgi:hypothetical protein
VVDDLFLQTIDDSGMLDISNKDSDKASIGIRQLLTNKLTVSAVLFCMPNDIARVSAVDVEDGGRRAEEWRRDGRRRRIGRRRSDKRRLPVQDPHYRHQSMFWSNLYSIAHFLHDTPFNSSYRSPVFV